MKNIATKKLLIFGFLLFSISCFGQYDDDRVMSKDIKPIKQVKSKSNPTEKRTTNENSNQTISIGQRRQPITTRDRIENLQGHIEAIDIKVEHISSDPKLKQKATEDKWFEQMQTIREALVSELNELKNK